jgi:hypothetical protein
MGRDPAFASIVVWQGLETLQPLAGEAIAELAVGVDPQQALVCV